MAPTVVGTPTTANKASGASLVVPVPSGVQAGELLVAAVTDQGTVTSATIPSGWTRVGPPQPLTGPANGGVRLLGLHVLPVVDPDALPPSYTWSCAPNGRGAAVMFRVSGVDLDDPISGASPPPINSSGGADITADSATVTDDDSLLLHVANSNIVSPNSSAVSSPPSGMDLVAHAQNPASGATNTSRTTATVCAGPVDAGATGSRTLTMAGTTAQRAAYLVALRAAPEPEPPAGTPRVSMWDGAEEHPVTVTVWDGVNEHPVDQVETMAPGPADIEAMLARQPFRWAHRGGSQSWPEMTVHAYTQTIHAGADALEISTFRSSDGVWVCSHDQTTLRVTGTDLDIPSTPWATLRELMTQPPAQASGQPARPLARLEEVLDLYLADCIIVLDNKDVSHGENLAMLDLLDSYGHPTDRVIWKNYMQSSAAADIFRSSGYLTWGYFYDAEIITQASRIPSWDLLGLNWSASSTHWQAALSHDKPVVAHIIESDTQAATALGHGAHGLQVARWH